MICIKRLKSLQLCGGIFLQNTSIRRAQTDINIIIQPFQETFFQGRRMRQESLKVSCDRNSDWKGLMGIFFPSPPPDLITYSNGAWFNFGPKVLEILCHDVCGSKLALVMSTFSYLCAMGRDEITVFDARHVFQHPSHGEIRWSASSSLYRRGKYDPQSLGNLDGVWFVIAGPFVWFLTETYVAVFICV